MSIRQGNSGLAVVSPTPATALATRKKTAPNRVFYAAGPGNAVSAHRNWKAGVHEPTEVSITFSGQIEQYCKEVGAALYIVAHPKRAEKLVDGTTVVEHLPKPNPDARGVAYHLRELSYGLQLLRRAVAFRADAAILDSGCTHYFWQTLFALFGMRVVPVLHNALWPNGYKPMGAVHRAIRFLDGFFWRHVPAATICVSPLCGRQVVEVAGGRSRPLAQVRAQFEPDYFQRIPPPPPFEQRPFRIMFIGRVTRAKGVFDILEMAKAIEETAPGAVRWTICGTGEDLEQLKRQRADMKLDSVVETPGWTSLEDLVAVYARSHCAIVPTRSAFVEGLAMTAAEAALAGRPLITNPVVPALEVLSPAAVACRTDDPASYVEQILKFINDRDWYERLQRACAEASRPFLDRRNGLTAVLKDVLGDRA